MAFIESSGGRPPRSARGLQQSTLERAFSGVYSLPEGGRPEARAASNRALWRGRLVAFTVFRRAAAPKRARPPTNRGLWRVRLMAFTVFRRAALQQSTLERAFSGVYRVFRRAAAPKRARHPTEHSGEGAQLRLQSSGGWPSNRAAIQQSTLERAFSGGLLEGGRPEACRGWTAPKRARHPTEHSGEGVQWRLQSSGGRPPRNVRGIQQSTLERAFSGVCSLPEGGRPEARGESNRAVWRECARHPTEQSGECDE